MTARLMRGMLYGIYHAAQSQGLHAHSACRGINHIVLYTNETVQMRFVYCIPEGLKLPEEDEMDRHHFLKNTFHMFADKLI